MNARSVRGIGSNKTVTSVAIIGFSPFGQSLALSLREAGSRVLVIDHDVAVVERLVPEVRCTSIDATDEAALRRAGISRFLTAVVAYGSDFEHSVMVTAALRSVGVPRIICEVSSQKHGAVLIRVGAHRIIEPQAEEGRRLGLELTDGIPTSS